MTRPALLSLTAPSGHVLAEGVRLAFEVRGFDLALVAAQEDSNLRLTLRRGADAPVALRDPPAMLELSEDLHPDQPLHPRDPVRRAEHRQAIAQLPVLALRLDQLISSTDPRDVDLNIHLLRGQIAPLAVLLSRPASAAQGFSLLDLATVPFLWRLDALDRAFETHLLTGHDTLRDRQDWLTRHRQLSEVLTSHLLADWLQTVTAAKGAFTHMDTRIDWTNALGPTDKPRTEKSLPSAPSRTKVHSIGGSGRVR